LTLEKIKGGIDQRKNSLKHFKENVFPTTSFFDNFFFLQVFDNFFSFFRCFGFRSSSAMTCFIKDGATRKKSLSGKLKNPVKTGYYFLENKGVFVKKLTRNRSLE